MYYRVSNPANQNHMQGIKSEHQYKDGEVGWGGSCTDGVGHVGIAWIMQGWGGSCTPQEWGGSCRDGMGWVMQGWGRVGHIRVGITGY